MPAAAPMLHSVCRSWKQVEAGTRDAIFDRIDVESPDWHRSWHADWKALRQLPESRGAIARGGAEISQSFIMGSGDDVELIYRLTPDDPALEIEVTIT